MKRSSVKVKTVVRFVLTVVLLVAVAAIASGRGMRHRNDAAGCREAELALSGASYSNLLNGLFAAGGR